jgi:thimet oligopeptidase
VAVPENAPIFKEIVAVRSRLATLLGYPSYAAFSLEPEMIGSPENAYKLIHELHDGTIEKTRQERMDLQSALGTIEPIHQWQVFYAKTLLGKKKLGGFSPEDAREYFRVATVVPGLLKHAEQFYGVKFIARPDVETWHETVLVFDVYDEDESKGLLGRIYLDHILRDGKQDHPCMMNITPGVKDKQLPEAILIVGLGSEEDATMSYWDATACWHELGHVMHQILGDYGQRYQRFSGIEVEADFVEAPSQLAEEWLKLPEVIKSFAKNKKGESIPDDMIDKLLQSNTYTKCIVLSGSHLVTARLAVRDRWLICEVIRHADRSCSIADVPRDYT